MPSLTLKRSTGPSKAAYTARTLTGNQYWQDGQAKDFDVKSPITITRLGVFDAEQNGLADRVVVCIYNRATQAIVPGLGPLTITNRDELRGAYRMRALPAPVTLPPGQYCVMTIGTISDMFGNRPANSTTKAVSPSVSFGGARYGTTPGPLTPFYPTVTESNDYDAGNFEFVEGAAATRTLIVPAAAGGAGAIATPSGVFASSAIGSILASGQASAAPAGTSAVATVGSVTASGTTVVNGTALPAGVSAAAAVGASAASGAANKTVAGVSASASVGAATATGTTVINGSAAPAGVSASAAVGSASASGATVIHGNATAAGVAASSALGATVARGSASAAANGVQAAAAVGSASANGGISVAGNAQPAGVSAVASVGMPSASGATVTHGNASAAGVSASASAGAVAISASASAQFAGVSVLATIGQSIASGQIQVNGVAYPGGVLAYARVGSATAGSQTYASAPAGPGYSRPFANTTRPRQVNTRRR